MPTSHLPRLPGRFRFAVALFVLAAASYFLWLSALPVGADTPSHEVSGRVYFGSQVAPSGAVVKAVIGGEAVAEAVVEDTGGAYALSIAQPEDADYGGESVGFRVYGADSTESLEWEAGGEDILDLRFEMSQLPPVPEDGRGVHDTDGDRLIEVGSLAQLDAVRHDLDGDGAADTESGSAAYAAAFAAPEDGGPVCNGGDFECYGYELSGDLDFADSPWSDGSGWLPLGLSRSGSYSAFFEGNGHAIRGLFIDRSNAFVMPGAVGLFGYVGAAGELRNLTLESGDVSAGRSVGLLAGYNAGTVAGVSVSGKIGDGHDAGGLVGRNGGVVRRSSADVRVDGDSNVGGLVGRNDYGAEIHWSSASGDVSSRTLGGWLGNIYGSYDVGGLVGHNDGTIYGSYATGDADGDNWVGGLVGWSTGRITVSYATGDVAGDGDDVGGFAGHNGGAVGAVYATGNVSGGGDVGGLVGHNAGTVVTAYSTGQVSGGDSRGRSLGSNHGEAFSVYWMGSSWLRRSGVGSGDTDGVAGATLGSLRSPVGYTGIYAAWEFDLDNEDEDYDYTTGGEDVWDFGNSLQLPALRADLDGDGEATWQEFGTQR